MDSFVTLSVGCVTLSVGYRLIAAREQREIVSGYLRQKKVPVSVFRRFVGVSLIGAGTLILLSSPYV